MRRSASILLAVAQLACGSTALPQAEPDAAAPISSDAGTSACDGAQQRVGFAACVATASRADCEAAGGAWVKASTAPASAEVCSCPTGQETCPCESSADCLAGCSDRSRAAAPPDSCEGADLRCEPTNLPFPGCACRFSSAGLVEAVCVD